MDRSIGEVSKRRKIMKNMRKTIYARPFTLMLSLCSTYFCVETYEKKSHRKLRHAISQANLRAYHMPTSLLRTAEQLVRIVGNDHLTITHVSPFCEHLFAEISKLLDCVRNLA